MHCLQLSLGQLRGLADQCGLHLVRESPLGALLDVSPAPLDTRIKDQLLLWRDALACVAEPRGRVRIITPGVAATKSAAFYVADGGQLVGCWPESGGIQVSLPWNSEQLAKAAAEVLMAGLPWPADPFSTKLSPAGLTALAAAVDCLKSKRLTALLNRQPGNGEAVLEKEALRRQFDLGRTGDDGRWVVTLLQLNAPAAVRVNGDSIDAGLAELTDSGLLRRAGNAWEANDALLRLARAWSIPLPALTHEVVVLKGDQSCEYRCLLAIRGEGPLWLFEFHDVLTPQPQIMLRSVTGQEYVRRLQQCLRVDLPPRVKVVSTETGRKCTQCGAPLVGAARFCASCGQPAPAAPAQPVVEAELVNTAPAKPAPSVRPPAQTPPAPVAPTSAQTTRTKQPPTHVAPPQSSKPKSDLPPLAPVSPALPDKCSNPDCGQPITPGKIFCPHCGTATGNSPAATRRCVNPECKQPVPLNKRFCTHCGAAYPG